MSREPLAEGTGGGPSATVDRARSASPVPQAVRRPTVSGKFLTVGSEKFLVRGVSYGTFRPGPDGIDYPTPRIVAADFEAMAANGFNTVRTYTVPPRWLLDLAHTHGLHVLVGTAWEQHVAFLDLHGTTDAIEERVRAGVRATTNHPAVLCYSIGNEIPAAIVRWHGHRRVQRFLRRLYDVVKEEDPDALVTYVNYPTSEYLDLPFLDLCCLNVYLESPHVLQAYIARLHNLAGDRPVILAEIGLDSRRHGAERQAEMLSWQIRTAFQAGCAGAVIFSWTDEWYITHLGSNGRGAGGSEIRDWTFGLTDRDRRPKPALSAAREAFRHVPPLRDDPPRVSVVVCTFNGAATLRDCLEGCTSLDYPDYEVIVVDDGSTDATPDIARGFDVRIVSTPNRGLSSARNTGLERATGEIVAYTDDDARPDRHWLRYLVSAFADDTYVAVGGPNIPPADDGLVAHCVANAPGGPMHVLLSDQVAEHIPGCNMAFRREALQRIGGFDPRFRAAGDDVDVCWRLQDAGGTIGFHAGAMVWHHRRNSLRAYLTQQFGYGRAEALLEHKWPQRYNPAGHVTWRGRLYGRGLVRSVTQRWPRIYHGPWGSAPFQSVYEPPADGIAALFQMPESYAVGGLLALLGLVGFVWPPSFVFGSLFGLLASVWVVQAVRSAAPARTVPGPWSPWRAWALTSALHLVQPLARLLGRQQAGLTPWRRRGTAPPTVHLWGRRQLFTPRWRNPDDRRRTLLTVLSDAGAVVQLGGPFDRWDLAVRGGLLGNTRILLATEEHGASMQTVRVRWWPAVLPGVTAALLVLAGLAVTAASDRATLASWVLTAMTAIAGGWTLRDVSRSAGQARAAVEAAWADEQDQAPETTGQGP